MLDQYYICGKCGLIRKVIMTICLANAVVFSVQFIERGTYFSNCTLVTRCSYVHTYVHNTCIEK